MSPPLAPPDAELPPAPLPPPVAGMPSAKRPESLDPHASAMHGSAAKSKPVMRRSCNLIWTPWCFVSRRAGGSWPVGEAPGLRDENRQERERT